MIAGPRGGQLFDHTVTKQTLWPMFQEFACMCMTAPLNGSKRGDAVVLLLMGFVKYSVLVVIPVILSFGISWADFVVTDGRFTNVYVYPDPSQETWEQHLQRLPANQKPKDSENFARSSIDAFTQALMSPEWPSYFGALYQYGGINPPLFFGSAVASQACVDAAMRDLHNGVLEQTTIRSLSNCHTAGMDPSPQVNLIFSPDIKIGEPVTSPLGAANGPDMCSQGVHAAYHNWGLNTPNFAVLPTAPGCAANFSNFTAAFSHEVIEMLSDPGQVGHGAWGGGELGDQCQGPDIPDITWKGFLNVQRYRSDNDNVCWPLSPPTGSTTVTWVLAEGSPVIRFTGDVHELTLNVPAARIVSDVPATQVQIWIQTGSDDLRGGNHSGDNANVTLNFAGGASLTSNINGGREWGNGQTHMAVLTLPPTPLRVRDIQSVTITTHFGGGVGGDNWNVERVALLVGFLGGSPSWQTQPPAIVREWLNASGGPLVRFTGDVHDHSEPVLPVDAGVPISALNLIIGTGNDDLRGGSHLNDDCDVTVELASGKTIVLTNVNQGHNWPNWSNHTVAIPLPPEGLHGGDVKSIKLHTGFGGGIDGDNWNVNQLRLEATLVDVKPPPPAPPPKAPSGCTVFGAGGTCGLVDFNCDAFSAADTIIVSSGRIGVSVTGKEPGTGHVTGSYLNEGKAAVTVCATKAGLTSCGDPIPDVTFGPPLCIAPPIHRDCAIPGQVLCQGVCQFSFSNPECRPH
jgi:hypothetical protein